MDVVSLGVFTETQDRIPKKDKVSTYDKVAAELESKPVKVPEGALMKALFWGGDGVGKSGVAMSIVDYINCEEGEQILFVDMDIGNLPTATVYHREEYEDGNLNIWNPIVKKKDNTSGEMKDEVLYKETLKQVRAAAIYVEENYKEKKIKTVVLDGLATLLSFCEWKTKIEKGLDAKGDVGQKYWVSRNKEFLEILNMYKALPVDVIFIGNSEFGIDLADKDASKVYRKVNDLIFQRVKFYTEETIEGKVEYYAKIEKTKQNIKSRGRNILFAEVDITNPESDYLWDPTDVLESLRPDPRARNRAKVVKEKEDGEF